jgi:hypothetical protein
MERPLEARGIGMTIRSGGFRAAVSLIVVAGVLGLVAGPAAAATRGVSLLVSLL